MKTLYLRNVPDDVSERLASLAAREGLRRVRGRFMTLRRTTLALSGTDRSTYRITTCVRIVTIASGS